MRCKNSFLSFSLTSLFHTQQVSSSGSVSNKCFGGTVRVLVRAQFIWLTCVIFLDPTQVPANRP